ncbi:hypothetical protein AKO1_013417 [Acrasis kona]|uniref:Uncharacterized protein n=1 Tax=Acrasis kona TaxID=1008807 RepID=A0AAW2ZJZ6_9EUKA
MSRKPGSADSDRREVVRLPYIHKSRPTSKENVRNKSSRPNSSKKYTNIDETFIESGAFLTKLPSAPSSYVDDDNTSVRSLSSVNEINHNRPDSSRSDSSERSFISDVTTLSTTSFVSVASTPTTMSTASAKKRSLSRTNSGGSIKTTHSLPGAPSDFDIRKYALENKVELREEEILEEDAQSDITFDLNQSIESDAFQIHFDDTEIESLMAEDVQVNQEELDVLRQEIEDAMETESVNSEALQEDISKFYTEQEDIRQGLEEYINQIKSKKDEEGERLVEFPQGFDEIINIYGHEIATNAKHVIKRDFWEEPTKEIMDMLSGDGITDEEAMKNIVMTQTEEEWLQKIHRLDFILLKLKMEQKSEENADQVRKILDDFIANKSKPVRKQIQEYREQVQGNVKVAKGPHGTRTRPRSASIGTPKARADLTSTTTDKKKDVKNDKVEKNKNQVGLGGEARFYRLTEDEEQVVHQIMSRGQDQDQPTLGEGYNLARDEAERLMQVNKRLKSLVSESRSGELCLESHFDVNNLSWDDSPIHLEEFVKKDRNTTGNKYLRELHSERQYKEKLKAINHKLSEIYNREEKITPVILDELLRQAKEEDRLLSERNGSLKVEIKSDGTLSTNVLI